MYDHKHKTILKAALQLFMQYGLRSVTMDDIAAGAGTSKKTIYYYFKDKQDLIDTLYGRILQLLQQRLAQLETQPLDAIQRLEKIIGMAVFANDYLSLQTMQDLKKINDQTCKKLDHFIQKSFISSLEKCIDDGKESDLLLEDINSQLMALLTANQVKFYLYDSKQKLARFSGIDRKEQVFRHLVYGMATAKGKKLADKYFSYSTTSQFK